MHATRRTRTRAGSAAWWFRREVTLGTLVQFAALLIVLGAAWSNLQRELALVRRDLDQLITTHAQLREHIETINGMCREHEYRLRRLEETTEQSAGDDVNTDGVG